jgi:hypothetical protein
VLRLSKQDSNHCGEKDAFACVAGIPRDTFGAALVALVIRKNGSELKGQNL